MITGKVVELGVAMFSLAMNASNREALMKTMYITMNQNAE